MVGELGAVRTAPATAQSVSQGSTRIATEEAANTGV